MKPSVIRVCPFCRRQHEPYRPAHGDQPASGVRCRDAKPQLHKTTPVPTFGDPVRAERFAARRARVQVRREEKRRRGNGPAPVPAAVAASDDAIWVWTEDPGAVQVAPAGGPGTA